MMKLCARCGVEKCFAEFNRNRSRQDGLQRQCKPCQVVTNREWANANPERRRATLRRQYRNEIDLIGYRESKKSGATKRRAHHLVESALRKGEMARPNECECCRAADRKLHAHHADYSKPLDVQWLCPPCHGAVHRESAA